MNPLFGSHRYAVVLLAQSQGALNLDHAAQRLASFASDTTSSSEAAPIAGFALNRTAGVLASDFGLQVASAALFYMPCSDDVIAEVYPGFGPNGYPSASGSGGACTAFCSTTGNACASPTVLNGVLGCPCANVTFAVVPTMLPSPSPSLAPSSLLTPLPTMQPTPLPSSITSAFACAFACAFRCADLAAYFSTLADALASSFISTDYFTFATSIYVPVRKAYGGMLVMHVVILLYP